MKRSLNESSSSIQDKTVRFSSIRDLINEKHIDRALDVISGYSTERIQQELSMSERCVLFIHSGLLGRLSLCESLAGTVDLSSDEMTDAVVEVLIRDRIAQATKTGLVAGLIRNGSADDVVTRTRTGLLELAARCLNDIVEALGRRAHSNSSVLTLPFARNEISSFLDDEVDLVSLDEAVRANTFSG